MPLNVKFKVLGVYHVQWVLGNSELEFKQLVIIEIQNLQIESKQYLALYTTLMTKVADIAKLTVNCCLHL